MPLLRAVACPPDSHVHAPSTTYSCLSNALGLFPGHDQNTVPAWAHTSDDHLRTLPSPNTLDKYEPKTVRIGVLTASKCQLRLQFEPYTTPFLWQRRGKLNFNKIVYVYSMYVLDLIRPASN
jgi:hypothetical protein